MTKRKHNENASPATNAESVPKKHKQQLQRYFKRLSLYFGHLLIKCNHALSRTVTVLIGADETPFDIHKDLLAAHSSYFAARFKTPWNSVDDTQFKLPEFKVPCF